MIMHKFLLPGLLSALRIPLSLLLLVVEPLSPGFFALYALCGLSDMLDGPLARRLDCVSKFGARLDSFADFLFCAAALYRLLPAFVRRLPPLVWAGAALVLLLRLAGCIVARLRRRPLAPPHTQLNRLTGLLLFLLPPLLPSRAFLPLCHIICAVAILAAQEELFIRREELIRTYKEQGRRKEIQTELRRMEKEWQAKSPTVPADLCWLYGSYMEDYLHDVEICQQFARRSRELMGQIILERTGMTGQDGFHTIHNYIDTTEMILRKGAIAAHKGEKVLIPINMRDGSILAIGRGNPDWNYSAPHGAGRVMSRATARNQLTMDEYKASMAGIYTTSVNTDTLDEAPMAYKSLDEIVDAVQESVDIIDIMKPIYNFKAAD